MKNSNSKYKYNDVPICPWCDHENEDWQEEGFKNEHGSTVEIDCSCGKKYLAELDVGFSFNSFSTKAIGCKPHRLKLIDKAVKLYECSECHNEYDNFDLNGKYPELEPDEYVIVGEK